MQQPDLSAAIVDSAVLAGTVSARRRLVSKNERSQHWARSEDAGRDQYIYTYIYIYIN